MVGKPKLLVISYKPHAGGCKPKAANLGIKRSLWKARLVTLTGPVFRPPEADFKKTELLC